MTEYLTRGMYAFIISVLIMSLAISCDTEDADTDGMEATEHMEGDHEGHDHDQMEDDDTQQQPNFKTTNQTGSITITGGTDSGKSYNLNEYTIWGYAAHVPPNNKLDSGVTFLIVNITERPGVTHNQPIPTDLPQPGITDQPVEVKGLTVEDEVD